MKFKVMVGTLVWTLFISIMHIQLNVGWDRAGSFIRSLYADVQKELQVGFLPVT